MKQTKTKILKVSIAVIFCCLLITTIHADDWFQWRGPNANGISMEKGWNPNVLKAGNNATWNINIGRGHSTVAVKGNQLFTMGSLSLTQGGKKVYEDVVFCLDSKSGKEIWRYAYPSKFRDFPGPGSTPVLDGTRLYTISREGELYCFDARRGRVIWKKHLTQLNLGKVPNWGHCASPLVVGDMLIINSGSSGLALNKKYGKVIWSSENKRGGLSTPILLSHQNKKLVAIVADGKLQAIDVKNGKVIWDYSWNSDADPVILKDQIFLTGGGRNKGSVLLDIKGTKPKVVWVDKSMNTPFQSCIIIGKYAYGFSRDRRKSPMQCVDISTGKLVWRQDMGEWGSLMAANGKLIIIEGDGEMIIAEASPKEYKEISRGRVLSMKSYRSYPRRDPNACWTAPVLANGYVYARNTYGDLVSVKVK